MAMLYPNLSAAVVDIAPSSWRASAIDIYRFWSDLGYGFGALGLGIAAALGGRIETAFWFVAIAIGLSGLLLYHWGEETHPHLNPAPPEFFVPVRHASDGPQFGDRDVSGEISSG